MNSCNDGWGFYPCFYYDVYTRLRHWPPGAEVPVDGHALAGQFTYLDNAMSALKHYKQLLPEQLWWVECRVESTQRPSTDDYAFYLAAETRAAVHNRALAAIDSEID